MLGATGRQVMGPIRGSGDFLAYGSPSISALGNSNVVDILVAVSSNDKFIFGAK
jgi:hypothetical protein